MDLQGQSIHARIHSYKTVALINCPHAVPTGAASAYYAHIALVRVSMLDVIFAVWRHETCHTCLVGDTNALRTIVIAYAPLLQACSAYSVTSHNFSVRKERQCIDNVRYSD